MLEGRIKKAFIQDFDLHFGDGTVNILERGYNHRVLGLNVMALIAGLEG